MQDEAAEQFRRLVFCPCGKWYQGAFLLDLAHAVH